MDKNIQTLRLALGETPHHQISAGCTVRQLCGATADFFRPVGPHYTSIDINIELWEQGVAFHETALNILSI